MNPFVSEKEKEELPSYIQFGLKVRETLQESFKDGVEFPSPDNIKGIEDLFDFAKNTVNGKWNSLNNKIKRDEIPKGIDIKSQLLAKLGGNADYLKNKSSERVSSGERYYLCGIAIFAKLFEKKLIIKTESGKYSIGDTKECINAISEISNDIIPLYTDDSSKSEDVEKYINKIRELKDDPQIKEFIEHLKE